MSPFVIVTAFVILLRSWAFSQVSDGIACGSQSRFAGLCRCLCPHRVHTAPSSASRLPPNRLLDTGSCGWTYQRATESLTDERGPALIASGWSHTAFPRQLPTWRVVQCASAGIDTGCTTTPEFQRVDLHHRLRLYPVAQHREHEGRPAPPVMSLGERGHGAALGDLLAAATANLHAVLGPWGGRPGRGRLPPCGTAPAPGERPRRCFSDHVRSQIRSAASVTVPR